jgi:hypothetical protein
MHKLYNLGYPLGGALTYNQYYCNDLFLQPLLSYAALARGLGKKANSRMFQPTTCSPEHHTFLRPQAMLDPYNPSLKSKILSYTLLKMSITNGLLAISDQHASTLNALRRTPLFEKKVTDPVLADEEYFGVTVNKAANIVDFDKLNADAFVDKEELTLPSTSSGLGLTITGLTAQVPTWPRST